MNYPPPTIGPEVEDWRATFALMGWITGYLEQVEAAMHDRTLSDTERRARGESALRLGAVGTGIAHGMRTDQPVGWSRRYVEQVKLWA